MAANVPKQTRTNDSDSCLVRTNGYPLRTIQVRGIAFRFSGSHGKPDPYSGEREKTS
jgi:hypothetical protein